MFTGLLHIHSLFRYLILIFLLIAIYKAFTGWLGKKPFTKSNKTMNLMSLIFAHSQLLFGIWVYAQSPVVQFSNLSNATKEVRFFTMEHGVMMIIAILLITLGYSLSKKGATDEAKHKRIAIFYLLALILILIAIPWPCGPFVVRGWMPGM